MELIKPKDYLIFYISSNSKLLVDTNIKLVQVELSSYPFGNALDSSIVDGENVDGRGVPTNAGSARLFGGH